MASPTKYDPAMCETECPTGYPDGPYEVEGISELIYDTQFASEKEMVDFVVGKLGDILGEDVVEVETEVTLPRKTSRRQARFRIDILCRGVSGKLYIIECKNPKYNGSLDVVLAATQAQMYSDIYEVVHGEEVQPAVFAGKINDFTCHHFAKRARDVRLFVVGKNYTAELRVN